MLYYSTRDRQNKSSLSEAVLNGLPPDNGLYMPQQLPILDPSFIKALPGLSFVEIAYRISLALFGDDLGKNDIRDIVEAALHFDTPLKQLDEQLFVLELYHGPTLAFKDVGARFMARLLQKIVRQQAEPLSILVATSGDTGSAVAQGFYGVPGIDVVLLYPSGKVSRIQEQQLATLGKNVRALEVQGTFDDCQKLVKQAFLDVQLRRQKRLSSANSINIARLLPQSFYYFYAIAELGKGEAPVFSVPSGNLGNLCAGLMAKRMGAPVSGFVAGLNQNNVFGDFLKSGDYTPRASQATLSNAMDVGAPSNLERIRDLYDDNLEEMRHDISAWSFNDDETLKAIGRLYDSYGYIADPHGAVGFLALEKAAPQCPGIFLETAHPAKFGESVKKAIGKEPAMPERLSQFLKRKKNSIPLPANYSTFKEFLLS